jgi:hypothetical protein
MTMADGGWRMADGGWRRRRVVDIKLSIEVRSPNPQSPSPPTLQVFCVSSNTFTVDKKALRADKG